MALANVATLLGGLSIFGHKTDYAMLSVAQLTSLRAQLQQRSKLTPHELFNEDKDIVGRLFLLKLDIETAQHTNISHELKAVSKAFLKAFDTQLEAKTDFNASADLQNILEQLTHLLWSKGKAQQRKSSTMKRLIFAMTAIPLLGFSLHYFSAEYYQTAFIDEAEVIFPRQAYKVNSAGQEIKVNFDDQTLEHFAHFYFQDFIANTIQERVSYLPGFIHLEYLEEYLEDPTYFGPFVSAPQGLQLPFINDLIANRKQFGHNLALFNASHFRFFVKNVKANHLVGTIKVSLHKKQDLAFPWEKLPTEAALDVYVSSSFDEDLQTSSEVSFTVSNAPVKDLSYEVSLFDNDSKHAGVIKGQIDGYLDPFHRDELAVTDLPQAIQLRNSLSAVYVEQSTVEEQDWIEDHWVSIDLSDPAAVFQLEEISFGHDWWGKPLILTCSNGANLFVGYFADLASALSLTPISRLEVDYQYTSVVDKQYSGQRQIKMDDGAWLLNDSVSLQSEKIQACLEGFESFNVWLLLIGSEPTGAGGPNFAALFNQIAVATMDADKVATSKITAQYQLIFSSVESSSTQYIDASMVLQNGHYIKLDVITANLSSGRYELALFADDEFSGVYEFEVLWPDHILFAPQDSSVVGTPFQAEN